MDRPAPADDLSLLEDFGQRVDLTRRIREVLVNYPEGTTVLKELIQNADDAGATRVCLCLDRRDHGTRSLLAPELAKWQGPALLAYNDGVFTEDDFVSISRIGDSKKQSQPWKTGRFGVGFNSVYHLTDLPSFVSDKYVVLFDPQGAYLPNISAANPGKRLNYVTTKAISMYEDQFRPYCAFGCDMKNPFPGTLFRLPLRNADQAAISRLSKQAYVEADISSMFSQLYEEAVFTLLFLKNVSSLEMYVWEDSLTEPQKLYSFSVSSINESTNWHRQAVVRFSNSTESSRLQMETFSLDFMTESLAPNFEKRIDTFFVVQRMAPASSKIGSFAIKAAKEYDVHLLPWASVAACITDGLSEDSFLKQGKAFFSLPLPVSTGLSVQVNGFFEISSNRRSIWYGDDMDRGGKLRSDWNRLLLEDVVAPAFNELILGLRQILGPSKLYYSLWPKGLHEEPWNILVEHIYRLICSSPVFYSNIGGGKWILLAEAFVHDEEFAKSKALGEALLLLGMPIIHLPDSLVNMLVNYSTYYLQRVIKPEVLRKYLKECKKLDSISRYHKLVLLEYCLSDLDDADVGKSANGLSLVPLASGEFGTLSEASKGISFLICDELEYGLFKVAASERIVDHSVPSELFIRLSNIARASKTNVQFVNGEIFLQFFPKFFPVDWKNKNRVPWNPESSSSFPTKDWFKLFWNYLQGRSYGLSLFEDWPILPSTSGNLHRALKSSRLLNVESLSSSMKELLTKIGCNILDASYKIEHPDLSVYVYDGNASGIINSIFETFAFNNQLQNIFEVFSVAEKKELCQFLLDQRWYLGASLSELDIKNCKRLPIYRIHTGGNSNELLFSDLVSSEKYLPPLGVREYLLGRDFINCMSQDDEDILMKYYGIKRMKKTLFYKENVLNRIDVLQADIRDAVMISIMQEVPQLCLEDSSFKESLKMLKFIPTINGSLKSPQSLYDPRVEELFALLEESECFPCGPYQEPGVLDMLLLLGLRTSVSTDTIIQSARQIESLMHKDPEKAHLRGKVLLSYLEVNAAKWMHNEPKENPKVNMLSKVTRARRAPDAFLQADLEKFWNDLRMICWCPVLVSQPYPALPWPSVSSLVAPPKIVRMQDDIWLVSASTRILDGECSSSALSFCLGWSSPPVGSVIAAQLLELGKNNEIVTDQLLRQELALSMPKIYSLLTNLIASDEMDIIKAVLEGCRWIWVGDGFATTDEVVLSGHLHLAPYIRVVPIDLAVFRELFLELGVKEFLKPLDYANILYRMATRKGQMPLDVQELRISLLVVQHLSEVQFQDLHMQIFLPDVSCRLLPSTDLVYNDAPWLLDIQDNSFNDVSDPAMSLNSNVHNFVHGNISNDMAEKLGVRSFRRSLLAESSDSMNLSLSGVAEAFGQHEALTTRLKHIVEMYADGPGILFELVQNAEDARASEVVFLLDKTQYGTSSILSPEMAEWQGPALYCFNDSVFTSKDLYAISRIGQDSKLEKPFAIGRFGLGFNCVYHFTDIPGFVSGENVVIFDPHASYLPGISPSHPGLRIKFVGRRMLEQFPDQFTPFLHFGCNLQESFPGTLFRFPLRTEIAASRSQIKKERYAPEDVESLLSSFCGVASDALLFLQSVKKITIFVKHGPGQDMQLVHCASRHNANRILNEIHPLNSMLDFIHGNRQNGMDMDAFIKKLSKTGDKDLPWKCEKVAIVEQSPVAHVAHLWAISESIGGGRARRKFIDTGNKSHKLIPWASVAAYLRSVELEDVKVLENIPIDLLDKAIHDRRKVEGKAFCFLPLPITTGLPVHVNAYFELSSNRRDLWFGSDMVGFGKARSEWNIFLLEDVVAPTLGRLLAIVAQETGPSDVFFSFWPTSMGVEPWASMVRKLYFSVVDLGLPVLFTKARGGQWIATKQAIFPDFSYPNGKELAEALAEAGLPVVSLSKPVVEMFMEACPTLHFLNPHLLRTLLIRRNRGLKDKDAAIMTLEYCLSDIDGSAAYDKLFGLPLIPLANGSFATIHKLVDGQGIFVTSKSEYNLLSGAVPQLIVDCSVPDRVMKKLYEIAHVGQSNILLLTCSSLVGLFPRILPAEWHQRRHVSWTPGLKGQPTVEWLQLLWKFIGESCKDLSIFAKWPILPVNNGYLLQLVQNSNVIRDEGWSENMNSLLQKMGFYLLRSDITVQHPQLEHFVQDATVNGILNALSSVASCAQDINALFTTASLGEKHELRSYILQSKWYSSNKLNIDMIKLLPIFECYKIRELTSLSNPTKWLKPEHVNADLLDECFVQAESDKERAILKNCLGIKEKTKCEFYKHHVLNRMSEFLARPSTISGILSDVKILIKDDPGVKSALSGIPFVLATNGVWQHPSRLYDPRVPGLWCMLHKEVYFPSEHFVEDEMLESLVSLGLKRTLGFTGLIDSAKSVMALFDSSNSDALYYGRTLLLHLNLVGLKLSNSSVENDLWNNLIFSKNDMLDQNTSQIEVQEDARFKFNQDILDLLFNFDVDQSEDEFWSEMKNISWCPVHISPPFDGLPWFPSDDFLAPPNLTRPRSQMWIVSCKMRVLDGDCISKYLEEKLGWLDPPNVRVLCSQLIELSRSYTKLRIQSDKELSVDAILGREILSLYSYLQDLSGTDDFIVLKEHLNEGVSWVYIGDNFVSPRSLAFDSPVKYHPYLYVVPSELTRFRSLLTELGVKITFDAADYLHALRHLRSDLKEGTLSEEQLNFVHRVLEAFADCYAEKKVPESLGNELLLPDSSGFLMHSSDLVYNDAPWMENISLDSPKHLIHPIILDDLAKKLGVKSISSLSFVDEQTMRDLPCMDYARICDLLSLYGERDFILFDLLELADMCKATKVEFIYDKREHPRYSLLQQNLSDFQGPSLTVVLEGAHLSMEELCSLQLPPPWNIQGTSIQYGLGLVSSYFICDLLTILSSGYFYIFDPLGLVFTSVGGPTARLFSLKDTDLTERFRDQFTPFTTKKSTESSSNLIIRMPLSSKFRKEENNEDKMLTKIFDQFMHRGSSTLLFLKSVLQVSLSTLDDGDSDLSLIYSVSVDPLLAINRNPFSEKKWRKFQISRLFSTSGAATKINVLDVHVLQGRNSFIDKWVVVLCLGSGQTRNMALDRRYLGYNLTPIAGVAAQITQNGFPITKHASSSILSPLPLSGTLSLPVTALGCFLVCHNGGRYLFNSSSEANLKDLQLEARNNLIEAWNRELMLCIRDAYVELVLEFYKLRKDPLSGSIEPNSAHAVGPVLQAYGDNIYSFWPRSKQHSSSLTEVDAFGHISSSNKGSEADWPSLVEQVIRPFYLRLVDLPVWQLYGGNAVKADEGMFLFQSGAEADNLPPPAVCSFIKEHYPVFSVPWELVREIQSVGIKIKEVKPKMVRDLLKSSSSVLLRSIDTYIDVLEYCLSDIQLQQLSSLTAIGASDGWNTMQVPNMATSSNTNAIRNHQNFVQGPGTSSGDALEIMTYFGKALYDFGRGVVEDIGRTSGPIVHRSNQLVPSIVTEFNGLPFPTATQGLTRIGVTELWIGSNEHLVLMRPLADKFIHPQCLEKTHLADFLSNQNIHEFLKLKTFSALLLSSNLKFLFSKHWINQVMTNRTPWVSWNNGADAQQDVPNPEWIRNFWKIFTSMNGELSLVADWPLLPAFHNGPVLCRVKELNLVFIPPVTDSSLANGVSLMNHEGIALTDFRVDQFSKAELKMLYHSAYELTNMRHPWLLSLLSQFKVPIFDMSFMDSDVPHIFFPALGKTTGQVVLSKFLALKVSGYFSVPLHLSNEDCDRLFVLFASDFESSDGSLYRREELDLLKELPIYRTVQGRYTKLFGSEQCIVPPTAFFHPRDDHCLSTPIYASSFLHALGVHELGDREILMRFALPEFEEKGSEEQEKILSYLSANWKDLEVDSAIVNTLKETKFVRTANELCLELFKPKELLDPCDALLASLFDDENNKFPGERFVTDVWLQILKKTGLKTSLQADTIIECAKKIELLGNRSIMHREEANDVVTDISSSTNEATFEIWSLADSLVELVFTNFATLYDNAFCDKLSKIAFVPAEKGFPSIGGKKGGKRVLSSYKEAILLRDWPLAWTYAPILVKQNVIPPEYSWGAFHLRSPPPFSTVVKHLEVVGKENGEDTLAHWPTLPGMITVEDAFLEVLKYLDKIWGTLSSSDITELERLAFLPVANGTRLVTANSLFVRLSVNLAPFTFELPSQYLPFVKILKEIGVQEVLTISYARDLLLNIQRSCGYQRLNPNELRAVMEVLNFICSEIIQASSDEVEWISDAIIPDDGCRLVLARSCVYVDYHGSQFIGNIDTSRLRFAHPELPEKIIGALRINKLSEIVVEELDEELQLQFLDQIGSVILNQIKVKLSSASLHAALYMVINSMTNHYPAFGGLSSVKVKSFLELIAEKLQFVQCLQTRFLLLPTHLDITRVTMNSSLSEWESNSKHRTSHFMEKSRTRILIAVPPSFMTIYDIISIAVSQVLGVPVTLPIGPLFSCPDGSEKAVVKLLRLASESGSLIFEGRNLLIGKELLSQDALQIQFLPLRPFYAGEIVAWKSGREGEKLRYGRVPEDVKPSAGQALYRFPVEVAHGQTEVLLSSQVFSFRSVSMADMASVSSSGSSTAGITQIRLVDDQETKEAGKGKLAIQTSKELQYGKVSAKELVQAVHDMLLTAGINMDNEKQALLQTTLSLQERLNESQVALLVEQEKAETATKEAETAKAAWSCRVCLSAEVNVSIVPCGHVLCQRCSSAVTRCPFCRTQVTRTMKIFRP